MKKLSIILSLFIALVGLVVFLNSEKSFKIISEEQQDTKIETEDLLNVVEKNNIQLLESSEKEEKNYQDKIISNLVFWGHKTTSTRKIDTIIIHSSYDAIGKNPYNVDGLLIEYKTYGVAPHYLIDRGGKVYLLVSEKDIAYHAGISSVPDGRKNVNDFSIGIEMMNLKNDKFTSDQYSSLNDLIQYIRERYAIKYVLGHNQIAPGRKDDPWNIDWSKVEK